MESIPSASYSLTLRVEFPHEAGALGRILTVVGEADGLVGAVDIVRMRQDRTVRDITVNARDSEHGQQVVKVVEDLPQVKVINVSDRTFLMHIGGKIEVRSKLQIRTRDDLSMVYTPGVARVCRAIASDPERAFNLTIKRNTVAVVSDGTAVLGLGDIGPLAAMPVMEGKAALFKQFANVDAFPICLDTKDADAIVETVKNLAPAFGGINLEDISAPRCFEVEERLKKELDIPVFHDDQHGTAVVVLAALINSLKIVGKEVEGLRIVVNGVGASGVACAKIITGGGRDEHRRLRLEGDRPRGTRGPQRVQAMVRREHQPRGQDRRPLGSRLGGRPLPRPLRAGRPHRRARREHEPRPDHLRHGQPRPRDKA